MKKLIFAGVALSLLIACNPTKQRPDREIAVKPPADPTAYAGTITQEELKEMLYVYSSDEFKGRDTGTEGEQKAVEFLSKYYVDNGIPSAKPKGDYYQSVPLIVNKAPEGSMVVNGETYTIGEHFATLSSPDSGTYGHNEIVIAGYGIEDDNYSDYKDIDVTGKLILIKGGEPQNEDGTYVISGGTEASKWSNPQQSLSAKINLAREKNAAGLLFYDDRIFPFMMNFMKSRGDNGMMALKGDENNFFYLFTNSEVVNAIDSSIDGVSGSATIATDMQITFKSNSENLDAKNVVAYIKGSEKPNEYIVISAHLDHVGVNKEGEIYNGADDDGSGTIAILEIAEAFKKAQAEGNGPKRSVVFLHVTGEEKGLLGSDYYTKEPIFPLANTVANLNIDMIGRIDEKHESNANYVYLIGADKISTELHDVSEAINTKYTNLELDYTYNDENDPNRFYYRSDHYNFAKNGVPIIFYFNGTHEDYHRVTDTPDKINYDALMQRTKLIFHTAWELANRENRIVSDKVSK